MFLFTSRSSRVSSRSSAEHGGGGGLEREELEPPCLFVSAAHFISGHLILVHFLLHLLEEIRHLDLLVVPQPVALHSDGGHQT